jgi:hypothetical protein
LVTSIDPFCSAASISFSAALFHRSCVRKGDPHHAVVARLKRNDVLARREHDPAERDHPLFADGLAYHGERLLADFAVGHDVVGIIEVKFVDLLLLD